MADEFGASMTFDDEELITLDADIDAEAAAADTSEQQQAAAPVDAVAATAPAASPSAAATDVNTEDEFPSASSSQQQQEQGQQQLSSPTGDDSHAVDLLSVSSSSAAPSPSASPTSAAGSSGSTLPAPTAAAASGTGSGAALTPAPVTKAISLSITTESPTAAVPIKTIPVVSSFEASTWSAAESPLAAAHATSNADTPTSDSNEASPPGQMRATSVIITPAPASPTPAVPPTPTALPSPGYLAPGASPLSASRALMPAMLSSASATAAMPAAAAASPASPVSRARSHTRTASADMQAHFAQLRLARQADPARQSRTSPFAPRNPVDSGSSALARVVSPVAAPPALQWHLQLCQACEAATVRVHCAQCVHDYCAACDAELHERGPKALRAHQRQPVSETLNCAAVQAGTSSTTANPAPAPTAVPAAAAAAAAASPGPASAPLPSPAALLASPTSIMTMIEGAETETETEAEADADADAPSEVRTDPEAEAEEYGEDDFDAAASASTVPTAAPSLASSPVAVADTAPSAAATPSAASAITSPIASSPAATLSHFTPTPVAATAATPSHVASAPSPLPATATSTPAPAPAPAVPAAMATPAATIAAAITPQLSVPPSAVAAAATSASASPSERVAREERAESAEYFSDEDFYAGEEEEQQDRPQQQQEQEQEQQQQEEEASPSKAHGRTFSKQASSTSGSSGSGSKKSTQHLAPLVSPALPASAQRIRAAHEAKLARQAKAALPLGPRKAAPAAAPGQEGFHPHERHAFAPQLNVRKKEAPAPKAVVRSKKQSQSGKTKKQSAQKQPKAKTGSDDEYGSDFDGADGDTGDGGDSADEAEEEFSTTSDSATVIPQLFHVLLQDPLSPAAVAPILEGMILPPTVLFRSSRASAVFYSDAAGFVRYHAWGPAEKREEARIRGEKGQAQGQHRGGVGPAGLRATSAAQGGPMLHAFNPHASPATAGVIVGASASGSGAALAQASSAAATAPSCFHPKSVEASAVEPAAVLAWFVPQLRERNVHFLRKQRHRETKRARARQRAEEVARSAAGVGAAVPLPLSPALPPVEEDADTDNYSDNYDDDEDGYSQDDTVSSATAAAAAAAPAVVAQAQSLEAQYAAAYSRSVNSRGFVNIEQWKREEKALMQARQKAAFAAAAAERQRIAQEEHQAAVRQEGLYVALLIYTAGPLPLPPPEALTLGQVRLLFRAPVLSRGSLPSENWAPSRQHEFLVQKIEYAPGLDHAVWRAVYDERVSNTSVALSRCQNAFRPPVGEDRQEGAAPGLSRAHEGFRFAEQCYTYKGPPESAEYTTEETASAASMGACSAWTDVSRRCKHVLLGLIRRVGEVGRKGRPCVLRMYFQQGVPTAAADGSGPGGAGAALASASGAPDAAAKALNAVNMSTGLMLPPDARKKKWYLLFGDMIELAPPRVSKALGAAADGAASSRPIALAAPALGPPMPGLGPSPDAPESDGTLFALDPATGETILPGIHGYAPPLLFSAQTVDRSTCVKCRAKLGPLTAAGEANMVMLRQVLLKWLPNALYEYPEDLFADVMGVDERPDAANWHRAVVACCADCLGEMRALKTIPPRTQLAPWLGAVAVGGAVVPTPSLADPQVQSGTKNQGGGVIVPAPATMPSLLPYLARAPMLHSRGSGHASQLVPAVAFVARKNVSMLEQQGLQGPCAGLGIRGEVEAGFANAGGGGGPGAAAVHRMHPSVWRDAQSRGGLGRTGTALSPPPLAGLGLGVRSAPDLSLSRVDTAEPSMMRAAPTVNQRGTYVMDSSYIHETSLNPHQHPTHALDLAGLGSPQRGLGGGVGAGAGGLSTAQGRSVRSSRSTASLASLGSPSREQRLAQARLASKLLGHSASVGALQRPAAKSSVAGGAGTAPSAPHLPLAPTVLFCPVKGAVAGHTRPLNHAWSATASPQQLASAASTGRSPQQQARTATSATKLPTLSSQLSPQTKQKMGYPASSSPAAVGGGAAAALANLRPHALQRQPSRAAPSSTSTAPSHSPQHRQGSLAAAVEESYEVSYAEDEYAEEHADAAAGADAAAAPADTSRMDPAQREQFHQWQQFQHQQQQQWEQFQEKQQQAAGGDADGWTQDASGNWVAADGSLWDPSANDAAAAAADGYGYDDSAAVAASATGRVTSTDEDAHDGGYFQSHISDDAGTDVSRSASLAHQTAAAPPTHHSAGGTVTRAADDDEEVAEEEEYADDF